MNERVSVPHVPEALPLDESHGIVASSGLRRWPAGRRPFGIEEARDWLAKPGHVVWIGLLEPSSISCGGYSAQFGLHDLAIEDARTPISGRSSNNTATRSSSSRARRS